MMLKNISKDFGGIKALDNCSLEIAQGITAIIGPNGSGKSTLFHVISRLEQEDKGTIIIDGVDVTKLSASVVAKKWISRTFQDVRLFKHLTIREHLSIAAATEDEKLLKSFFGRVKEKNDYSVLELVHLIKSIDTTVTELSYGQRKLLDLAIAIVKPHSILLLDEPVAGVNPKVRHQIKQVLKKLREQGQTIVIIEHDMNFVMDIADDVFVLDAGRVIAHDKPAQIRTNKKVLEAYLGT